MSFFPVEPVQPEVDPPESAQPPWWGPPEDGLPALLAVSEALAVTEHVAIALIGAFVHREGVELRIERRLRRLALSRREWNDLAGRFVEHGPFGEQDDPAERLRYGVVLGDGERVLDGRPFDMGGPGADPSVPPDGHSLMRTGGSGGGGERSYSSSDGLWLWPLPPDGAIELVMQWRALGIGESRVVLDGTAIRALTQRAAPLWPA